MKLIQKMAIEHLAKQEPWNSGYIAILNPLLENSFIDGFLACREMAAKKVKELRIETNFPESGNQVWAIDPRDWALIELLGEEEV